MSETGTTPNPNPDIDAAAARDAIAGIALETPVLRSDELSDAAGADVWLKLENLQRTGSFKIRGATNRILALTEEERSRGVIACSSGNHGRAVACVSEIVNVAATVCVPEWVDPVKRTAIQDHGAEAVLHGSTYDEAEERSYQIQQERGLVYVHPFDDPMVIAGQGTIGLELLDQLPGLDTIVCPLSGGGLIAGIAIAVKSLRPEIRVVGVSAERARVMHESLGAGRPIEFPEEETIASALSGGIGRENRYSFRFVRDFVDEYLLVSEEEIIEAMLFAASDLKLVVEGGGAVGIAALRAGKVEHPGETTAVVVSGGNVDLNVLRGLIGG